MKTTRSAHPQCSYLFSFYGCPPSYGCFLTSTSVWSTLEHVLASPSNYLIMQLDDIFQDLCQGDDTITIYL
jgi:hypothetical protein